MKADLLYILYARIGGIHKYILQAKLPKQLR